MDRSDPAGGDLMIWTFHEPGCIPGMPGLFANCRVEVAEDGSTTVLPLFPPVDKPATNEQPTEAVTPETIEEA